MSWNYRVVRHVYKDSSEHYKIHEVYYSTDEHVVTSITAWSSEGMAPFGVTPDELKEDLGYMLAAFEKPILHAEDLPGYKDD